MDPAMSAAIGSATSKLVGAGVDAIFGGDDTPLDAGDYAQAARATIRGKVEGAKAAGISPLYALGAPTISPVASVGGGPTLGETLSDMGQDVSRAVAQGQTDEQRTLQALTLDKAALENDFLREQISSLRARTIRESAPPLPAAPGLIPSKSASPQLTTGVNVGVGVPSNPYFSDAQTYEDRYGEIGGSMLGFVNMIADPAYNWWNHLNSSLQRDFGFTLK